MKTFSSPEFVIAIVAIAVTDEAGDVKNIINYRQYNKALKEGGQLDATKKAIPSEDARL